MPVCRYLLISYLELCNNFSNPFLQSFRVLKKKKVSVAEDEKRIDN